MKLNSNKLVISIALTCISTILIGCGASEPSAAEMLPALNKKFAADIANANQRGGMALGYTPSNLKEVTKRTCKADGENTFLCYVQYPMGNSGMNVEPRSYRFVKTSEGWTVGQK